MTAQYAKTYTLDHEVSLSPQIVGREHELAFIWSQYEAARNGNARVMLLSGELGIGKTRLLQEFAARAEQDGATVLRGGASESEGMPPYLPFLEALGSYIRTAPQERLREQVAVAPQTLANILPELAARLGEQPGQYSLPPEQARLRLYEAVGLFLKATGAPHALVLTLDDLQWADTASLDLLCHITRHQSKARLLVLGAYREGEIDRTPALERAINELAHQRVLIRVAVDPLSVKEVEALAAGHLGAPVSSALSLLLHTQGEGNPFFAEELLRNWIEVGALVQENNYWVAVAPLDHALPPSIVGALRQRFARLSSDIIDLLRVAAIIGRAFDVSLLAEVEGQEIEVLEERLLVARRAGLLRADQKGVFTFSHDKIREVLYAEVSTSRRQRLHGAIGRVLEARYDRGNAKSSYRLAELAFHFARSSDRERGAIYSMQAAEQALQSYAIEEALAHYRAALDLLDPDDRRRGNLLLGMGQAALLAGAESQAASAYEEARTWLSQDGEWEAAARVAHGLGLAQWRQEALQAAREALEQALELLKDERSAKVVRILVDLSTLLTLFLGQQAEGGAYAQQALEMARRLGDKSLEAAASRAASGRLYVPARDIPLAVQSMEQALALFEASDDPSEAAECCLYLEGAYYWMAEVRRSHEMSLRRIEFIERCRYPYQLRNAYSWSAFLLCSQGEWAKARLAIERAQPIAASLSSPAPLAFLHQVRGFLAYQQEEYAFAEWEFQAAKAHPPRGSGGLIYTGLLGLAQVAVGKREEAYAYITKLEGSLADLPTGSLPTAPILICLALTAIALGDQQRISDLYPRLLTFRGQLYWFLVDRVLGELATLCRDREMAAIHLAAAQSTAQREGLRPELARILLAQAGIELARGGQAGATGARNLLRQALVIFEELNMADSANRVRSQLDALSHQLYRSDRQSLPASLTTSEARVLKLVVAGKSNRLIAHELGLSEKTIANHLTHIFEKTSSENRAAAAAFAIRHGLA